MNNLKFDEDKSGHSMVSALIIVIYLLSMSLSGFSVMWLIGFLFVIPFSWELWISKMRHGLLGKFMLMMAVVQVWTALCMFF